MRVIALVATYNEELFVAGCIEHLASQGVQVYLIDNCSTDRTVALAERYAGSGLVGLETFPRHDVYNWRAILQRKERLAATLAADWVMHVDADEIPLPPRVDQTLAQALAEAETQGYNAVNFLEFTFVPTREAPDHEHTGFQDSMRFYYPFAPAFPHLTRAWRQQADPPELAWSGGHHVRFPGIRLSPAPFRMRHYLFLSVPHAIRKYVNKRYDRAEVDAGWHGWRARLRADAIRLPFSAELRPYRDDRDLDPSDARSRHCLDDLWRGPRNHTDPQSCC